MLNSSPTARDCIDMLGKLVSFDTTSRNSNLALIEFVREELAAIGVESRLTFNEDRSKANLWATMGWGHKIGGGDCLLKTQGSAKPQGEV